MRAVEELLTGRKLDAETIRLAAETALKGAKPMAQNVYKLPLFKGVIEEELTAISVA